MRAPSLTFPKLSDLPGGAAAAELAATKEALLEACEATARGTQSSDEARDEIDGLIDALASLNPRAATETGRSSDLTGKWALMFTTEQVINHPTTNT